ncbi:lamin tail domain-containing protein [Corynebacterium sp. Q4381]|uniref:lamin tail domain-containing protein n=1 Tax=Corynebacterium sp. Marseille-Q4381 TaxID=3121597 RepID=UPI002FE5BEA6
MTAVVSPLAQAAPAQTGSEPSTTGGANVLISEMTNTGPGGNGDIFFEMQNYGDAPQDLTGWSVYRCIGTGVRASVPQLSVEQLDGVVLQPGQRFTAGRAGQAGDDIKAVQDATFGISFATQYGLMIFDQNGKIVDRIGSSRPDVASFCANGSPLPGTLNGLHAESWQRVGITGDAREDFVVAPRTPGRRNAEAPSERRAPSSVKITEVANGGEGGAGDNFFEITNLGTEAVDVTGWQVYRCTGTGRVYNEMLQLNMPAGKLEPGQVFLAAREGSASTVDSPDATYGTSFNANDGFGVMLVDQNLDIVDAVGVFDRVDSPCSLGEPLPNTLDFPSNESFQRVADTDNNKADFVRATRTPGVHNPAEITPIELQEPKLGNLLINEIAAGGATGQKAQYVEIINRGDAEEDLSGLRVDYCAADGRRMSKSAAIVPEGIKLAPGGVFTVARAEAGVDGALETEQLFEQDGYGAMLTDATGALLDRVAVYYDDVGKVTNAPEGPCSGETSVPLDRRMRFTSIEEAQKHDYAWHRVQATGNNWADFFTDKATPGSAEGPEYRDVTEPLEGTLDPVQVDRKQEFAPAQISDTATDSGRALTVKAGSAADATALGAKTAKIDWENSAGFIGTSKGEALETRVGENETRAADVRNMDQAVDATHAFPYQRFELAVEKPEGNDISIAWSGTSRDRHEVQMYFFNHTTGTWDRVGTAAGAKGEELTLVGSGAAADYYRDGKVDVLVQDGKRTADPFSDSGSEANQMFKTPGEYDFAIAHVTDSQYLVEQNPTSFTQMIAFLVANRDARDIIATVHTGDVIQNWLRGNQEPDRAVLENERASKIMKILEDADMPYGILPGNHDNAWGNSNDMFNEYYPVSRFENKPWFGDHGPDGMASNYFTLEKDGSKWLFLQMGYDSSEEEIEWADGVIKAHPDHNVVFGTHEYLKPEIDERSNPANGRWMAQGDVLFERLVEPNSNVVLVLSGHLHGVRQRLTEREDGTKVFETVADYQSYEEDGARDALYTRLYQVDLDSGILAGNAYSPRLQSFEPWKNDVRDLGYTPESDEFTFEVPLQYEKVVATSGIAAFGTAETVGSAELRAGSAVTFDWNDLDKGDEYVWFARSNGNVDGRDETRYSNLRVFTAEAPEEVPPVTTTVTTTVTATPGATTTVATPTTVVSPTTVVKPGETVTETATVTVTPTPSGSSDGSSKSSSVGGSSIAGSSATVGSSVTATPLGVLLGLLAAIGGIVAVLGAMNASGITIDQLIAQFQQ